MKKIIKSLTFVLMVCYTTGCTQEKSGQEWIPGLPFTVNGEQFEMMVVEGGSFMMGCTKEQGNDCNFNEKPVHEETVSTFYIGRYEVTQKLWNAVMGPGQSWSYNSGCEDCPVERVSWKDAQEFISKLNALTEKTFRLPTETEWEYAARGGNRSKGYKYSGSNKVDEVAWYIENYEKSKYGNRGTTHPVGMKKPNELGIYDMSGNVWEWCDDWYTKEYEHDGKVIHQGWPFKGDRVFFRRIIRGGSWGGTAEGCRVSFCDYDVGDYRDEYGGFRLALDVELASDSTEIISNIDIQ